MILSDGQTFLLNHNENTLLVDGCATKHFLDDTLIPDPKEKMLNYTVSKCRNK